MSEKEIENHLKEIIKKEKAYIKIDSFPILATKIFNLKKAKCQCGKITKNIILRDKKGVYSVIGKYCRQCKNMYIFSKKMRIFYATLEDYNANDLLLRIKK